MKFSIFLLTPLQKQKKTNYFQIILDWLYLWSAEDLHFRNVQFKQEPSISLGIDVRSITAILFLA